MEKLNALFDDVRAHLENHRDAKLKDFMDYLKLLQDHGVLIKRSVGVIAPGRVRLMTAHKSKGQEFDYVYIVNAYDTHWGNRRGLDYFRLPESVENAEFTTNDVERRLFYVAITRARRDVSIS